MTELQKKIKSTRIGDVRRNITQLEELLRLFALEFSNTESKQSGAAGGWSGTMRSSQSGQAISILTNGVHRGGQHSFDRSYLIQIKVGGALPFEQKKLALDLAKQILSKFTFITEYGDSSIEETNGTNWSSVMLLPATDSDDTSYAWKGVNKLKEIKSVNELTKMKSLRNHITESFVNEAKIAPKKTTVDKFFLWYTGGEKNWEKQGSDIETSMTIDGEHAEDDGTEGLSTKRFLWKNRNTAIEVEINDFGNVYDHSFTVGGKEISIDATNEFDKLL